MRRRATDFDSDSDSDGDGAWPSTGSVARDARASNLMLGYLLLLLLKRMIEALGRQTGKAEIREVEMGSTIPILQTAKTAFILIQAESKRLWSCTAFSKFQRHNSE